MRKKKKEKRGRRQRRSNCWRRIKDRENCWWRIDDNEEIEGNNVDEDDQYEEDIFDEEGEGLREGLREGGKLSERVGNEHLGNLLYSWIGVA